MAILKKGCNLGRGIFKNTPSQISILHKLNCFSILDFTLCPYDMSCEEDIRIR